MTRDPKKHGFGNLNQAVWMLTSGDIKKNCYFDNGDCKFAY